MHSWERLLRRNNFTFNKAHFIHINGTVMGARVVPNFANVNMGRFEENRVVQLPCNLFTVHRWHFLNMETGHGFLNCIHWPHEQRSTVNKIYTRNISTHSVNFLDTTIIKVDKWTSALTSIRKLKTHTHTYTGLQNTHYTFNKTSRTAKHRD